jgi:hypothetical protein
MHPQTTKNAQLQIMTDQNLNVQQQQLLEQQRLLNQSKSHGGSMGQTQEMQRLNQSRGGSRTGQVFHSQNQMIVPSMNFM